MARKDDLVESSKQRGDSAGKAQNDPANRVDEASAAAHKQELMAETDNNRISELKEASKHRDEKLKTMQDCSQQLEAKAEDQSGRFTSLQGSAHTT